MTPALLLKEKQMKRKTVRKEIIEEFDANGQLKSRTTIEETEEEDETSTLNTSKTDYWNPKLTSTSAIQSTELEGQVTICEYCNGETNKYESYGR